MLRFRSCLPLVAMVAMLALAGTAAAQICPAISAYPYVETFDSYGATNGGTTLPFGWAQDPTDATGGNDDWFSRNTATPSQNTGPPADHTTGVSGMGFYLYAEDSAPGDYMMVNVDTPCFDLTPLTFPVLSFWVHSNNNATPTTTGENFLSLDVIDVFGAMTTPDVVGPVGHLGQQWQQFFVDLSPFQGTIVRFRFRARTDNGGVANFTHDMAIDDFSIVDGNPVDLAISSIDTPVSQTACGILLTSTETVSVTVTSFGAAPLPIGTLITFDYSIDGGPNVFETFTLTSAVAPFTSFPYSFTTPADFSLPGLHSLTCTVTLPDSVPANDSLTVQLNAGTPMLVTTYPYLENFDTFTTVDGTTLPPPCWIQDQTDASGTGQPDWVFNTSATANGSPPADNSGTGFYGFVSDASEHTTVNLDTPPLDLSSLANPGMQFFVYSNNTNSPPANFENFLHIDVVDFNTMQVTPDIVPPIGHVGAAWTQQSVSLSQFVGQIVQVRFRGSSFNGNNTHHIAIDDVGVLDVPQSMGQAPQLGAAVFDINNASTAAGFPVAPGNRGPYFASTRTGDPFIMEFEGQPNQIILLLFGPLNVGAATLPFNIGQIDIGGPIDPMTNFPSGVSLLANGGNTSGFNIFFRTTPAGTATVGLPTPNLPLGILGAFQSIIFNSVTVVRASNAVEVNVVP